MSSYIIFHPDHERQRLKVKAKALAGSIEMVGKWTGDVIVDKVGVGNEDPWCISQPWLYSYCHATQLRRSEIKSEDIIFFISGDKANRGILSCDTIFVIDEKLPWHRRIKRRRWVPSKIPTSLKTHQQEKSPEWLRHLRFGLPSAESNHGGRYTFTALPYKRGAKVHSFLPIMESGVNTSFKFSALPRSLVGKIRTKSSGKFPVPLADQEAANLYKQIFDKTKTKVVNIFE